MKAKGNGNIRKILFVALIACCVILAFVLFIQGNNKRAVEISVTSLKDATNQSAQRIEEILDRAQGEILLVSSLYEEMLDTPEVDAEDMGVLTEESFFDDIAFADERGIAVGATGEEKDVSGRDFYQEGMQGHSGLSVVLDETATENNTIVFYTPQYYNGEIIGVLVGVYREQQMEEILYSSFFGEDSRTYLCTQDGSVVASGKGAYSARSIFDSEAFNGALTEDVEDALWASLLQGEDFQFQYQGTRGTGNAYVTLLKNSGWILVQSFPSQVTSRFIENANGAGVQLLVELIVLFVICLITLQVAALIQRKRLLKENKDKSYVVDGLMQLFGTFVLMDLEQQTYRYLEHTLPRDKNFPIQGSCDAFFEHVLDLLTDEEEREHLSKALTIEALRKHLGGDTTNIRYEYRVKGDAEAWDSLNIICIKCEGGVPVELLLTYQDVTKAKERERRSYVALKEAYQAVESANHAKSNFLSNMSHDIRTPMNAIMGMTAIAAMNMENQERVKDCLNKITVSSQHLLGLINEVLDMSKIESGKMIFSEEQFNLSDVVDSAISMFLPQTGAKNQTFQVNVDHIDHEEVIGDRMRLQQIFVNILGNAVKFTPEGGKIRLDIIEKPSHMHGCGCYVFTFEDNGIGMEESFMEHLFEPFVRADNSRTGSVEGTGLGMPIVKNIVQMMNGDIQVESKLDVGTKFVVTVYLKLSHSEQGDLSGLENLAVLVADDDEYACENACNVLNEIGMKADWVLSGDEAVQTLVEAHDDSRDYVAVILDWQMPGKDGIETAREIRAKLGDEVPIIILSAFDYSSIEQEARAAGVNAFISKPLFRSRLVYVMKTLILGNHEGETELQQLQNRDYSGKRILLVEDNELNMEIAEELLLRTGVQVERAENGRIAVDRVLEQPAGYFDLIFMDIQMPQMNGYDATIAIRTSGRADLKTLPIVAMSADAFSDDVQHAKKVGMNGHIAKPVEIEKLLMCLEEWISPCNQKTEDEDE